MIYQIVILSYYIMIYLIAIICWCVLPHDDFMRKVAKWYVIIVSILTVLSGLFLAFLV